ncbi:HIT domain-containing protein [Mycobacterium sp. IS-1496]|uniref:HIT family protein n=1 Tax=Mycobacterium sp. IS-1496 TaxID=1772284 RepID=UPI0009EAF411
MSHASGGAREVSDVLEPTCPFCDIIAGAAPARVVANFELAIAFFPTSPAAVGHTLVVPKRHLAQVWSLDATTAASLCQATMALVHAVKHAVNPEGLSVIQSNGEAATQTVAHLHIHVLPRWVDDGIGPNWPLEATVDSEPLERALAKMRSDLEVQGDGL